MSSLASLSCYPQRAAFDLRAPAAALPPPAVSSLDASATTTRSMHASPMQQLPIAHKVAAAANTTTMPLAMPVYASTLKGPQHWRPHALAAASAISPPHKLSSPLAQPIPPTVPYHSGLAASLLAHKQQNQGGAPPTTGTAAAVSDISPSLCLPLMQRGESVPSSSGSTASFTSAFGSAAASPLPSPRQRNDSPLADDPPPCPISLWFGCEDATHARCVLAAYAAKLQLYTQQAPGCRAPLEFIGRVRRDRLDVGKLHRAVEQFHNKARQRASQRQPRQRYASAASPRYSGGFGRRPFASSPCMSSFSPSSSPCSSGLMAEPTALDRLPASGSFATLDLVSIYSRDTLPLGLAFPLIRHEWVCTVWNQEDGVAESCTRIHTEYEDDEPTPEHDAEEKRQNDDEDDEDARAKRVLQLYAKSVQKMSKKASSTKGSPSADSSIALQLDRSHHSHHHPHPHHPFSLTASIASAPSGSWHPATSAAPSQHSDQQPSAATAGASTTTPLQSQQSSQGRSRSVSHTPCPPPTTAFLYCLPIFSEDCKNGSYDTFGCRVQRDTDATLSSSRTSAGGDKAGARAALPSVSQAGSVATVGDHSLGYAGAQNSCIYECMKTLGRKIAGGSNGGLGVGNGGDDSTGEANCAQTVVDHEMEMRAIAAALTKMQQQQQQQIGDIGDSTAAAAAADGDLSSSSESSQSRSCSREGDDEDDNLDSIGEDVMFPASGATPGAEATGFEFGASDDDEESSDSESDSDSDSGSGSDSDSDSSDSDAAAQQRSKRNVSGSKAVVIQGAGASRRSHGVAATEGDDDDDEELSDDDDDDVSSSCASSYARSFGGSGSMAAGSLGDELAAQLMALNGGRATANNNNKAAKGRK